MTGFCFVVVMSRKLLVLRCLREGECGWQALPVGDLGELVRVLRRKSYIGASPKMVNLPTDPLSD